MWNNNQITLFGVEHNGVKMYFVHKSICKYGNTAHAHLKRDALSLIADKRLRSIARKNNFVSLADKLNNDM